jgi:outer membrane protein OmpA-like peptidoglycan-associated protein
LKFKGKSGKDKSGIQSYCDLPVSSNNLVWLQFHPPHSGRMNLALKTSGDSIIVFIFETSVTDDCGSISSKKATLVTCENRSALDTLNPIYKCSADKNYYIALYVNKGKAPLIDLKLNYTPLTSEGTVLKDSLLLNLAYSKELPVYGIHFRDELTGFPVIAKLSLVASSLIDGTYRGSDILVNNQRKLKASLRIDSEGYYSKDIFEHPIPSTTHHDTIFLAPITHGAITKLDDIYFAGGLAIILEESMPRLKRLKDFLLLNPTISIEVQGHVNDEGGNSLSSQRLSKKRAKRIVAYLISCGIEPERLSAVGYGNTKPIFPKPESEEQKEANRRVEVKIK